jgi:chemotaxis protein methyltransferase CheR
METARAAGARPAVGAAAPPITRQTALRPAHVAIFARIARARAGIVIQGEKTDFLRSRLTRRMTQLGVADYDAYCALLEADEPEQTLFIEALATHTTSFFREPAQYDWLRDVGIPELYAAGIGRARPLVYWSAACSNGAEGYSALMLTDWLRRLRYRDLRQRLIGTDISRQAIRLAERAVYNEEDVTPVPADMRRICVMRARARDGRCRIIPELRALATWRVANLTDPATLSDIRADVAFLRNVLIYFDEAMQQRVIANVLSRLAPGGYLFTGHTETATTRRIGVTVIRPSIYRKES